MIPDIECHCLEVVELCRSFGVRRLVVFGSAADGTFDPARRDIDFLVEFDETDSSNVFSRYFGMAEALEQLFARKVDLVSPSALKNSYFSAAVNRSRQPLNALAGAQAA